MDEFGMKDILYYKITYSCLYAHMVQLNIQYIVRGKCVVNIIIFMLFSMSSVYVGLYTHTNACMHMKWFQNAELWMDYIW